MQAVSIRPRGSQERESDQSVPCNFFGTCSISIGAQSVSESSDFCSGDSKGWSFRLRLAMAKLAVLMLHRLPERTFETARVEPRPGVRSSWLLLSDRLVIIYLCFQPTPDSGASRKPDSPRI